MHADEADALRPNIDRLRMLNASRSLDTSDEAFSSWMYTMNMNVLTVHWPEALGIRCNSSNAAFPPFFS